MSESLVEKLSRRECITVNEDDNLNSVIGQVSDRDLFSISSNNDVNARVVLVKLDLKNSSQFDITKLSGLNVTVRFDS